MGRRDNGTGEKSSVRVALGGVLGAGSLAILWLASVAPSGRLGLAAAAGLFPMAATLYAGRMAGYLCWLSGSILGMILLPDKGVSLLYLMFLGLYPVVKGRIEALRRLPVEWVLKLVYFNLALTLCWFVFRELFLPSVPDWLQEHALLLYGVGSAVFVIYDIGLSKLIAMLRVRLGRGKGRSA